MRAMPASGGWGRQTQRTPEEEQELLRAKFRHVRGDIGERPRRPSEWLRTGGPGAVRFDDLSTGAHVIVILNKLGALAGEVTEVPEPGIKRRAFAMRPWGWAEDLRVLRREVRSIRLVGSHTWRERQIVAKQQRAKRESSNKD